MLFIFTEFLRRVESTAEKIYKIYVLPHTDDLLTFQEFSKINISPK